MRHSSSSRRSLASSWRFSSTTFEDTFVVVSFLIWIQCCRYINSIKLGLPQITKLILNGGWDGGSQEAEEEEKEILLRNMGRRLSSREEYSHNLEERVFNPHFSPARNFACVLLTTDALIGLRHGDCLHSSTVFEQRHNTFFPTVANSIEWYVVEVFICGLPWELGNDVRLFKPKSLKDAYCLALLQEAILEAVQEKEMGQNWI
ncbi:hypothetical protein Tco_0769728 [Tanacetum coccineum]|uniref:Uncharacterized protein n=1 Tax=Tanacetum coccineum TaxID=301880 RepID=A0ABQ4ZB53_9ASTR